MRQPHRLCRKHRLQPRLLDDADDEGDEVDADTIDSGVERDLHFCPVDKEGAVDPDEARTEHVLPLADAGPVAVLPAVPCALLPAAYGTVVYIISLIIRVVRKPKM